MGGQPSSMITGPKTVLHGGGGRQPSSMITGPKTVLHGDGHSWGVVGGLLSLPLSGLGCCKRVVKVSQSGHCEDSAL